jgi:hypothetical protein
MVVKQSTTELMAHLKEQIEFLKRSSKAFDEGYASEAKRMAVVIRLLLHNTNKSHSLLHLLGKDDILFYNTASKTDNKGKMSTHRLIGVMMKVGGGKSGSSFWAPLDDRNKSIDVNRKIGFLQWWNGIVIIDKKMNRISRKNLILWVSNHDGGAHIDPILNKAYADLTRFNSLGWMTIDSKGMSKDLKGGELTSIRQICHELLKSLKDEFPQFF